MQPSFPPLPHNNEIANPQPPTGLFIQDNDEINEVWSDILQQRSSKIKKMEVDKGPYGRPLSVLGAKISILESFP